MKTKSRNSLITSLTMLVMMVALLFSVVAISPLTAFAQGEITVPKIVSVGGIEVDQETTMGGAPSALKGQPYSAQVVATGGDLTYSAGAGEYMKLPKGLTINAETGLISGTCTEETGRYNCLIKATNAMGEASVVIGITVGDSTCIPEIETAAGSLGQTYKNSNSQFIVSAENNNASMSIYNFSWSIKSGALPDGMKLSYTSSRTVYITGTPTATGTFNFELEVKNDFGTASRSYSISVVEGSVRPNIVASGESLGYGVVGKLYEYQLEATGTNSNEDPMLWSTDSDNFSQESYDLGNGLSMSKTGLITGTPQTNTQVSFNVYAKNSVGTDSESFYILIYNNGEATTSAITPEVAVVAKGSSKEFTISLEGYGDVEQVAYWSFFMYDDDLGSPFPQPTNSELSVNSSTPSKTVTLTVGEDETRGQIRVVAYSKPGNGGVKTWATVTIVEKTAVIYNVSFDKNGGSGEMASVPVEENDKYTLPSCDFTAPVNYEFKCWKVNGDEKAVGSQITITADTTITAVWQLSKIKNVEITGMPEFVVGGDIVTNASVLSVPANANYKITGLGWYDMTADEWANGQFVAGHTYQFSVDVVAKEGFEFGGYGEIVATVDGNPAEVYKNGAQIMVKYIVGNPIAYTITFDANGGSGTMEPVEVGGNYVLPECEFTPPEGKTFDKWSVSGAGPKEPGNAVIVGEDLTITAMWKDAIVMTTISFLPGEGSGEMQSVDVEKGSVYTLPECEFTPKDKYSTFSHWMIEPGTSTRPSGYKMTVLSDYTLTAVWVHGCKLDLVDAVPANCATEAFGKKAYYVCNGCGNKYEDKNGENVIANFENWGVVDYQHDFSGEIVMNDATTHGFKCVNEGCEKVGDFVSHEFDGWKADDLEHWQECACGYEKSRDSHSGGTATCTEKAICSVCNTAYGEALGHEAQDVWSTDGEYHWHECTRCEEQLDKAAHADENNDGKCDICQYTMSVIHTHNYGTTWESDENNHWNECECGDKANTAPHADKNNDGKCDICDYAMGTPENPGGDKEPEKTGLSGGAIAGIAVGSVAVVGLGGFSLFWFVIKKKKFADLIALFKKK